MARKSIVLGIALVVLNIGSLVFAQNNQQQGQGQWHHRGQGGILQHLTRIYNLSDAQQTQIKAMWESEKPNVVPLLQQLEQGHKEMLAATANGAFDEARVNTLAQQQSQTIARLIVEKEKLQAGFFKILTPAQRTQFATNQQRHDQRLEQMLLKLAQ